jgi:hypothetical protein
MMGSYNEWRLLKKLETLSAQEAENIRVMEQVRDYLLGYMITTVGGPSEESLPIHRAFHTLNTRLSEAYGKDFLGWQD